MKRATGLAAFVFAILLAAPVLAAEQAPMLEEGRRPGPDVGYSLAAAGMNVVFFPCRFAVTAVTAGVGGLAGLLTGGDYLAADSIWASTDGQAFVTPGILERRERLQVGPWD